MRWGDLQVVLAIHRTKHLAAAGQLLGASHSTVWRRLKSLEKALDQKVFISSGAEYRLTDFGGTLIRHALRIEEEFHAIGRVAGAYASDVKGTVRVTAPESFLGLLVGAAAEVGRRYSGIQLDLVFSDGFVDLARQHADVAIRASNEPPLHWVGRRVATIAWAVYGPPGTCMEDAKTGRWIGYSDSLAHLPACRWFANGPYAATQALKVSSIPAMKTVLGRADRFGLLPCFVGDADESIQRVSELLDEASSTLWVLFHPDLRHSPRVSAVSDIFFNALRQERELLEGKRDSPVGDHEVDLPTGD